MYRDPIWPDVLMALTALVGLAAALWLVWAVVA